MDRVKLKRYLRNNITELVSHGIRIQELIALYFDLRPIVRIGADRGRFKLWKQISLDLGLKLLATDLCYGPNSNDPLFLLSKSKVKNKKFYNLEKTDPGSPLLGKYLGYPTCCQEKFKINIKQGKNNNGPTLTLQNTKGKMNFLLNYLYNLDSRQFNYTKYNEISKSYFLGNVYLIPQIPCTFNCENSIKFAEKLLNLIKSYAPIYYKRMLFILKKPILFFDDFTFFPLNGRTGNNSVSYNSFFIVHNRLPIKIVKLLKNGNLICKDSDVVRMYYGNRLLKTFNSQVKLFSFE